MALDWKRYSPTLRGWSPSWLLLLAACGLLLVGVDAVLLKALTNLLGIYPVGTCVILDSRELAIVHAANSDTAMIHRPTVRVICTADGTWLRPGPLLDLSETTEDGHFGRTIIKVIKPEKYGIRIADYFV